MKKVIITGGRNYEDEEKLYNILTLINPDIIIQGGAFGADHLARDWATFNRIECITVLADWAKHGKAAGPIRNIEMLDTNTDAIVIAFPGGKGTKHCTEAALKRNMIVLNVLE